MFEVVSLPRIGHANPTAPPRQITYISASSVPRYATATTGATAGGSTGSAVAATSYRLIMRP